MQVNKIHIINYIFNNYLVKVNTGINIISLNFISLLLGFFISTSISTIPAQTGDWGLVAGALIVTIQEIVSKIIYKHNSPIYKINSCKKILKYCNSIKIGIIYGLFVDAFKLGS